MHDVQRWIYLFPVQVAACSSIHLELFQRLDDDVHLDHLFSSLDFVISVSDVDSVGIRFCFTDDYNLVRLTVTSPWRENGWDVPMMKLH